MASSQLCLANQSSDRTKSAGMTKVSRPERWWCLVPNEKKKPKKEKLPCVDDLRHAEYYGMQEIFDNLYKRSKEGEVFTDLMETILSRENILLAYRNIKTNTGGNTPGTDKLTIKDIGSLTADELVEKVRYIVAGSANGYTPKPVRRKDIPKPNGKTRPLGIPCIWDRLVQQCTKQVMEPICEAKFSNNSYGFRPNRSVENAIAHCYRLMQQSHLEYVVEFDIKGFFDNVNHKKLLRQIRSTMRIRDKKLLAVIRRILKAPIRMPDGKTIYPDKGTPQGGIVSPLLANIVLNDLDYWIDSQWEENPVTRKYSIRINSNGSEIKSHGYAAMRETNLKEMFIVRYADDFRIFCRSKEEAEHIKIATTKWLAERLKLEISEEKTKVVNVKRHYSEFLGLKFKLRKKDKKEVVTSHISDKAMERIRKNLIEQAKRIARPRDRKGEIGEILLYNQMVMGIQNYYQIATEVSRDLARIQWAVSKILYNRLKTNKGSRLIKTGRELTPFEAKRYGKSQMLRYVAGTEEPIYPIGYIQCKNPMCKKRAVCCYTAEGRGKIHSNLRVNVGLMLQLMRTSDPHNSVEYTDNRISLFSAQFGKCAVTGKEFKAVGDIHCHHITPRNKGGTDKYEDLVLVLGQVHKLIHATREETINKDLNLLALNKNQLKKLNFYRTKAGNTPIANTTVNETNSQKGRSLRAAQA